MHGANRVHQNVKHFSKIADKWTYGHEQKTIVK